MIALEKICKQYPGPRGAVKALDHIDLEISSGEFVVIRGPSGSGKTTLLLTIGGMLHPTSGRLIVDGRDIYTLAKKDRARFRAEKIGFVFQLFHLIPYLNLMENVLLPVGAYSGDKPPGPEQALSLLDRLHLGDRSDHYPAAVSAGEKQRAAIARAMILSPALLLADEPTGNLDPGNAAVIAGCLADFHKEGCTVVVVTHGHDCDPRADRILQLDRGRIANP